MKKLSHDELKQRIIKAGRVVLHNVPKQSPAARSAEVLFQKLTYFLGTDRQDFYVQDVIRYLQITIKEKVNEKNREEYIRQHLSSDDFESE